jgi:hypothetical protein
MSRERSRALMLRSTDFGCFLPPEFDDEREGDEEDWNEGAEDDFDHMDEEEYWDSTAACP